MAKRQHAIELNGITYDAISGEVLAKATRSQKTTGNSKQSVKVVDGFTKRKAATPKSVTPATAVHQKTNRSRTLMRATVKKPVQKKVHAKSAVITLPKQISSTTGVQALASDIKPERAARAAIITRSRFVSKFRPAANTVAKKPTLKVAPLAVNPGPSAPTTRASATAKAYATSSLSKKTFEAAITSATSHEQPKIKKPRLHEKIAHKLHLKPKTFVTIMAGAVLLSAGGYAAYNRVPTVAMQFAVARAGVKASLPSYRPAGFGLSGPIEYTPGQISFAFHSNTDQRSFRVVQKSSQWNSETLLENFIHEEKKQFQTLQSNGRTIYIYDGSNATWVDGGIWYQIEGNSSLNSDQLIRIANSL